jgi:hypothetical protein
MVIVYVKVYSQMEYLKNQLIIGQGKLEALFF